MEKKSYKIIGCVDYNGPGKSGQSSIENEFRAKSDEEATKVIEDVVAAKQSDPAAQRVAMVLLGEGKEIIRIENLRETCRIRKEKGRGWIQLEQWEAGVSSHE